MSVEIYTKEGCHPCVQTKEFFKKQGIEYIEKPISRFMPELREKFPEVRSVPQVFIDGNRVGGYNETVNHFKPS